VVIEGKVRSGAVFPLVVLVGRHIRKQYLRWSSWGAKEDGNLLVDLPWDREASFFVDVIGIVIMYVEAAHQTSFEVL